MLRNTHLKWFVEIVDLEEKLRAPQLGLSKACWRLVEVWRVRFDNCKMACTSLESPFSLPQNVLEALLSVSVKWCFLSEAHKEKTWHTYLWQSHQYCSGDVQWRSRPQPEESLCTERNSRNATPCNTTILVFPHTLITIEGMLAASLVSGSNAAFQYGIGTLVVWFTCRWRAWDLG